MTDGVIYVRLRPGHARRQPAFQVGELYPFLEETYPAGYVYVELHGQRRCVWAADFEQVPTESK